MYTTVVGGNNFRVVLKLECATINVVEINLFDAVSSFSTLFSDISRVKHNIGLTLFSYFTSA